MSFVHLHGHSTFSFLEAIGKPNAILSKAKELEMNAIAITDYNGMYGIIKFYQMAKDEGIKPIVGVELGFVLDIDSTTNINQIGNIVLIAKNKEGYQNLMDITAIANTKGIKNKPKIDINVLKQYGKGIIAIFGGIESWIGKMFAVDEKETKIIEIIQMIKDTVDDVYLEIIAQDYKNVPEIKKINNLIFEIAKKNKLECVVNNNYHYPKKEDKEAWETALAIKDGKKIYDQDRRKPKGEYFIMSENEIREILIQNGFEKNEIDGFIENNNKVADSIQTEIDLNQVLFPNYINPEDIIQLYDEVKDSLLVDE
ncbi:MAG: PHP domain-containing protein [Candidatus Absconditabacterales bacterium]